MRLEDSWSSGGRAINRMSGSSRPGKDAATPIVSLLGLLCNNAGVPLLVTWGSQGAGLGPVLSPTCLQHPSPESFLSFQTYLLPTRVQIPNPCSTHSAQGVPSLFLCLSLPPQFPGGTGSWGAGDLGKVTLEHGQRAEGQVLGHLKGLLHLSKDGDPLRRLRGRQRGKKVPQPPHGCPNSGWGCIDSRILDPSGALTPTPAHQLWILGLQGCQVLSSDRKWSVPRAERLWYGHGPAER